MFYDCKSLIIFNNFELNDNEIKDKLGEKEKYLDSEDINKDNNFYQDGIDESIINGNIITEFHGAIRRFQKTILSIFSRNGISKFRKNK